MSLFEVGAVLIGLSAVFGYINHRYLRAPHTIGLVLIALAASLAMLLVESVAPAANVDALILGVLGSIDFHETLMHGMLSFLLFAGALHVDLSALRRRYRTIGVMATAGTLISTLLIGTGTWLLAGWGGHPIPFIWALVFGALISPTDPVAVLALFRTVPVPPSLKVTLAGESLFNDGVGVVVFTLVVGVALQGGEPGLLHIGELFAVEVLGGGALGLVAGYTGYRAVHRVDERNLQVLITLAVVMVCYAAAIRLDASGPIAMVAAGLFVGNEGMEYAADEASQEYLRKFWSLLDNIINSVLFLLIGLEVLIIVRGGFEYWMGLLVVPVALAGRGLSVLVSIAALRRWEAPLKGAVPVLTWGGLRGGIAVALALSLPANDYRPFILSITYVVVLFSIIVQGLTVARLIQRVVPAQSAASR
ncbi:MAG: sodium:proton antiporter [Gammaproteobacteria bacterium]|nr:sodium:proton antiporter [Gammaproteobacteria bacterium]